MRDPMRQNNRPQWTDLSVDVGHKKSADGITASSFYYKRYFSVLDAEIYFGNRFVEDVAHIDWQVQQNNMPLFGYNSYTYDEMARGNRIIMGTFDINFTTPKYLYQILRAAGKDQGSSITEMKSYNVPTLGSKYKPNINQSLYGETKGSKHYPKWPDTFDIDILFGQKTAVGNPVHIILEGVVLGSCQMVLDGAAAGTPPNVMERYTFYARDIKTSCDGGVEEQSAETENKDSNPKEPENKSKTDNKDTPKEKYEELSAQRLDALKEAAKYKTAMTQNYQKANGKMPSDEDLLKWAQEHDKGNYSKWKEKNDMAYALDAERMPYYDR